MSAVGLLTSFESRLHGLSPDEAAGWLVQGAFLGADNRYLYVETPKAACSTLKWLLAELDGRPIRPRPAGFETSPDMAIHVAQVHRFRSLLSLAPDELDRFLADDRVIRFGVVRNPYARLVSAWADKIRQREPLFAWVWQAVAAQDGTDPEHCPTFAAFARWVVSTGDVARCDPHWRGQTWLLLPDLIRHTHILRIESLEADLSIVLGRLAPGQDAATLLKKFRLNDSLAAPPWQSLYEPALAACVHDFYAEDFRRYGYDPDSWRATETAPLVRSVSEQRLEDRALRIIRDRNRVIHEYHRRYGPLPTDDATLSDIVDLLRNLGASLLASGEPEKAVAALGPAHRLRPGGPAIRLLLARALHACHRPEEARHHLLYVLQFPGHRAEALALLNRFFPASAAQGSAT